MMARTPVVAFECQIQPEIYPRNLALVVKNKLEFSNAVLNILKNDKKREKMTKDAKKFVLDNFSREAMTRKLRELFAKVHKGMDF